MDDIKGEPAASESESAETPSAPPKPAHRSVGPEAEVRGGSEAPDKTLRDEAAPFTPPDGMPGERAALPAGSLSGPYLPAQGDENRSPPSNAPSGVNPTKTVDSPPRRQP